MQEVLIWSSRDADEYLAFRAEPWAADSDEYYEGPDVTSSCWGPTFGPN